VRCKLLFNHLEESLCGIHTPTTIAIGVSDSELGAGNAIYCEMNLVDI
jgi:hypothetical protein